MGDPEIRNDEKVFLRTNGVYVKSIPFEGILTNKRVILVDRAKNLLPPKEIPFSTIKDVESGENAIRDQTITLTVMAKTGDTRQMILTFSRREGGNRIKERDEWARAIRQNIGSGFDTVIRRVIPSTEPAAPAAPPHINVVNTPMYPAAEPAPPAPARSETGGMHPIKRIIESGTIASVPPAPPAREFDIPAPGQHIFCSRCGNKVPADSAFCNRCGSPVVAPSAPATASSQPTAQPAVPATAPAAPSLRPIDQDIRTIEPLIERSTARIPADPLLKPVPDVPVQQTLAWDEDDIPAPVPAESPAPAASAPARQVEKPEKGGFIPQIFSSRARTPAPSSPSPAAVPPVPEKPRRSSGFQPSRNLLLGVGAIILLIVIVAAGAFFIYPMLTSGESPALPGTSATQTPSSSVTSSSTPNPSGTIVPLETQAAVIPPTGVYVHVNYLGGFKGSYGMVDALTTVPGNSGDRVWEVENANGMVIAEFEKLDGSGHDLLVEIYNNGVLLTGDSTAIGHGSVKLSTDIAGSVAVTEATTAPVTTTA